MGIAQTLARRTEVRVAHAARTGLERLAHHIAANGGAPLDIVLPDGAALNFGRPSSVRLLVRDLSLLAELARPSIALLAEAYVHGRVDIQGSLLDALPLAEQLVNAGGASVRQRIAELFLRHSARVDREAIS